MTTTDLFKQTADHEMPAESLVPDAPCPHRELCGGCRTNGQGYEKTLAEKEGEVRGFFKEQGMILSELNYASIRGCAPEERFRYRNKMEYTFGDLIKDGETELGLHKQGSYMSILTVDHCQLVPEDFNRILRYTLDFVRARGYKHYHKKSHQGLLRNLIIRRGVRTQELLVDIVTTSEGPGLDEQAWKDGLLSLPLDDRICGILHTINDDRADAVKCDEQRILYGRDHYYEEICGLRFKVGIFSFFQTNIKAVERMYLEAVSLLSEINGKTVYDLFCGTGTISQIVASRGADAVYGVEIVEDSVRAARDNTGLNGITNCEFLCGDVYEVLNQAGETLPAPDVIIVDPPRMGLRTKAVQKIASYGVPEILYISCNPKTLAVNLADFRGCGYEPVYIKAYDNFCWTKHVECVVLMSKVK